VSNVAENRVYAGQPHVERVDDRRSQLVRAAYELMADEGSAAVTMRAVTRNAQLSPRYFYESFATRAELLVAVLEQTAAVLGADVAEAIGHAPLDPEAQTRAAFSAVVAACERDPRIPKVLFREALSEVELREQLRDGTPGFIAATSILLADEAWLGTGETARVQLDVSALAGALSNILLDWTEGRLPVTSTELVDYCTETVATMVQRRAR